MRFHRLPDTLLTSPARVAVLRTMLGAPGREWTGREVARAAGVSPPQALAALRLFGDEGLTREKRIGKASVWTLDRGHFLAQKLAAVVELDPESQRALRRALEEGVAGSGALEAFHFGSTAAGSEDPNSDVDLLVVFPDARRAKAWAPRLRRLERDVRARFGNTLQGLVYTSREVGQGAPARLLKAAREGGSAVEVRP